MNAIAPIYERSRQDAYSEVSLTPRPQYPSVDILTDAIERLTTVRDELRWLDA